MNDERFRMPRHTEVTDVLPQCSGGRMRSAIYFDADM
jgi:hypothetical protein